MPTSSGVTARLPERSESAPLADELCPVPFYSLQQFLGAKGTSPRVGRGIRSWITRRSARRPTRDDLAALAKQGGYDAEFGWTGNAADVPTVEQPATASVPDKLSADGAEREPCLGCPSPITPLT